MINNADLLLNEAMREYKDLSILPPTVAKLPWTHNTILIDKVKEPEKRLWYAKKTLENGWSKTVLDHQIDFPIKTISEPFIVRYHHHNNC